MQTIQAGIQGSTPTLEVKPIDPTLPRCQKAVDGGFCTRAMGHYGRCGVSQ